MLIGLKSDLREDKSVIAELAKNNQKPVSYEEGVQASQKIGAYKYLECSARKNEGVKVVFEHATRAALMKRTRNTKSKCCLL